MFRNRRYRSYEIAPEEIFLDSSNLPAHEKSQFEGRVERPMSRRAIFGVGIVFSIIAVVFSARAFNLQVAHGATYADISLNNSLNSNIIFAQRGIIYDRTGKELAWNSAPITDGTTTRPYALRQYISDPGFSLLLGFVTYPKADQSGVWWREHYAGVEGIEQSFNDELEGVNGASMTETDAHGKIVQQNIVTPPQNGQNLTLSIDADVQKELYKDLVAGAHVDGFVGGAGVIMNLQTGELLAITSFPQYDNNAFEQGDSAAITAANTSPDSPLLNRAVGGLYAPGSIVKPIFAAGALDAGIISPDKEIISTGAITIPNPYDPSNPSVFHDWTVHGPIDMRTAIAVSSDEYFYTIAGGYKDQQGLGIANLDKYAALFGLGSTTGIDLSGEQAGLIPSPAWKARVFDGQPWLLGDTYHTGIGQFGFQITPLQAVRFAGGLATGKLFTPQLLASSTPEFTTVPISEANLQVVRDGMRLAVTSNRTDATLKMFNIPGIEIAAKSGTAQLGNHNQWVNSWVIAFWPADNPKYALAAVLEKGPATETFNAASSVAPFFTWLVQNHPEYANP
ncbi:MAG TPA: penicillin-binding transpeptidase domain-containing protein [Candidatus Paceibacterota bacterium]|nr:penicillin-binding transpeptidase domain-containing protein [Candidatus Paceibacterota bacterium]